MLLISEIKPLEFNWLSFMYLAVKQATVFNISIVITGL